MLDSNLIHLHIEKKIRFMRRTNQLEDMRPLSYVRLQDMMVLVMAVTHCQDGLFRLENKPGALLKSISQERPNVCAESQASISMLLQ
jgi:hypothetical protein